MHYRYLDSPLGRLLLAADQQGLRLLRLPGERQAPEPHWLAAQAQLDRACRQLEEYFDGRRKRFELPLAPHGTPFQRQVWQALLDIPHGQTWSYRQLAGHIGKPAAVRAVGSANGANPIALIIPCHRVIGSDGSLTGYSGGLEFKQRLLQLEGALLL